jgi:hypothetical protein
VNGINHLVLAARDLDALAAHYAGLGFTLAPRSQHPFGTGNVVVQLRGGYIELLSVTRPDDIVEHDRDRFSFSAFNRDYLARHEGFSMLVMGSDDASADNAAWRAAGLPTYSPFDFKRQARLPDGEEITVGFSLAFTSTPAAPWLGHFACQHYRPDYFEQSRYLTHDNGARTIADVWISGQDALALRDHMAAFTGVRAMSGAGRIDFATPNATIVLAEPPVFENAFGVLPPHPADGPHLAGFTVGCSTLEALPTARLAAVGDGYVLPPDRNFGTALRFIKA